jgi:hypothetical protein
MTLDPSLSGVGAASLPGATNAVGAVQMHGQETVFYRHSACLNVEAGDVGPKRVQQFQSERWSWHFISSLWLDK